MHIAARAFVVMTALIFAGCSGGGGNSATPSVAPPNTLAPQSGQSGTIKPYRVQLAANKTLFLAEPSTVAVNGNTVTVSYPSGHTETYQGSSPTVRNITATYTFTPKPNDRATQCFRPPCTCPVQYSVYPYDQATSYPETVNSGQWSYVMLFRAPTWDDNVSGTELIDFSGYYTSDGSYFDVNYGSQSGFQFSAYSDSTTIVSGGASQDEVGISTYKLNFTDIYNQHWD